MNVMAFGPKEELFIDAKGLSMPSPGQALGTKAFLVDFLNVLNRINLFWGSRPPMKVFTTTYKDMYTAALMVWLDER